MRDAEEVVDDPPERDLLETARMAVQQPQQPQGRHCRDGHLDQGRPGREAERQGHERSDAEPDAATAADAVAGADELRVVGVSIPPGPGVRGVH